MAYRTYEKLCRWVASVVPLAATACASAEGGEINSAQFTAQVCSRTATGGRGYTALQGVQAAEGFDYLELREFSEWDEPGDLEMRSVIESTGVLCSGAADEAKCKGRFAALPIQSDFRRREQGEERYRSVALSSGDEVAALGNDADLRRFLGTIDSIGDAATLALAHNHRIDCDEPNASPVEDGYVLLTSTGGCDNDAYRHVIHVSTAGEIEVRQSEFDFAVDTACGRLPAGLRLASTSQASSAVGRFFARVAQLEAAAVPAFAQVAAELVAHGAPAALTRRALRARRDEIRHAATAFALARRFGGRPAAPRVSPWRPRPLVDAAAENAIEGCVRETYGALVAHHQALRAGDPQVRRAFAGIARDETRHAALSWDIARWARERMSVPQRRRVARATRAALDRFDAELAREVDETVCRVAGVPDGNGARRFVDAVRGLHGRTLAPTV